MAETVYRDCTDRSRVQRVVGTKLIDGVENVVVALILLVEARVGQGREQMGHPSIQQETVDICHHYVQGSNKQAVDRLDDPVDSPKAEVESATIHNQGAEAQVKEERFQSEPIEKTGAGDPD